MFEPKEEVSYKSDGTQGIERNVEPCQISRVKHHEADRNSRLIEEFKGNEEIRMGLGEDLRLWQ